MFETKIGKIFLLSPICIILFLGSACVKKEVAKENFEEENNGTIQDNETEKDNDNRKGQIDSSTSIIEEIIESERTDCKEVVKENSEEKNNVPSQETVPEKDNSEGQKDTSTSTVDEIIEPERTDCKDELDTACWKTYRNHEDGYEIKFPSVWGVDSSNLKKVFIGSNFIHRESNGIFLIILEGPIENRINELKNRDALTSVVDEKKITVGDYEAIKLILTAAIGYENLYYFFQKDTTYYELSGINNEKYHQESFLSFKIY